MIRAAELRYFGQDHLLAVELQGDASTPLAEATQLFHDKHERLYGFRRDDVPVELVRLQLAVVGRRSEVEAAAPASRNGNASGTSARRLFAGGAWRDAKSYDRGSLSAGTTVDGPCIIEEPGCTTYVPAGFSAKVDELGLLRIAVPPMPSVNSDEEII